MTEGDNHTYFTAVDIEKYHRGELPAAAMHAMEKAALDDPFLAEAMEGYGIHYQKSKTPKSSVQQDLADLQNRLDDRVSKKEKTRVIPFLWWKVAAVVLVFLGAAWFYVSINNRSAVQNIAKQETVQKEVPVTTATDSGLPAIADNTVADNPKSMARTEKKSLPPDHPTTLSAQPTARPSGAEAATRNNAGAEREESEKNLSESFADSLSRKTPGLEIIADKTANARSNTFNGRLMDAGDQPLANATVQIPNLHIATVTNDRGYFSFKAPDTALRVTVASTGFETMNLDLTNNSIANTANIIRLKPSLLSLKEANAKLAQTEQKRARSPKAKDITIQVLEAEPVIGWNDYRSYLELHKKIPDELSDVHGEVLVSFMVDEKNTLRHFRIAQSIDEQLDAEAIRLIKNGPAWRLLNGKKAWVSVTVVF